MPHMTTTDLRTLMDIAVVKAGLLKNAAVPGQPETLFLVKDKYSKGSIGGVECDVYDIKNMAGPVEVEEPDESLYSYIVDYAVGETNFQVLADEADFCFTVTINGCTFARGIPAVDGTLIVSHTNMNRARDSSAVVDVGAVTGGVDYEPAVAPMVQENVQSRIAQQMHGTGTMLGPSQYYNPTRSNNLTVFGIRGVAGWTFFYQSYRRASGVYHLEGVHDFAASSIAF